MTLLIDRIVPGSLLLSPSKLFSGIVGLATSLIGQDFLDFPGQLHSKPGELHERHDAETDAEAEQPSNVGKVVGPTLSSRCGKLDCCGGFEEDL